ncbi:MAG: triose-phosphate isomerase [Rickettsiales bacterium]|jgi:triosephosphate isomerase|nr:triose-phosphate isomerase [Rickettsiales bacterium]
MKIIAGNWKMNGNKAMLWEMITAIGEIETENKVIICPPSTLIDEATSVDANMNDIDFSIGAQDCSAHDSGAFTGEISAAMLDEVGAKYVIVGHSERRQYHGETSEVVHAKANAALKNGLTPIICVGETLADKQAGKTNEVLGAQLAGSIPAEGEIIVAYEPVWAIGTGLTATADEIKATHKFIADAIKGRSPILYGGSVKPGNAAEIMNTENVGGVLVGGAALKKEDFLPIILAV